MPNSRKILQANSVIILSMCAVLGCVPEDTTPPSKPVVTVTNNPPPVTSPGKPKEIKNDPVSDHWTENGEQALGGKTCSTWWQVPNITPEVYFSTVKVFVSGKWPKAGFQSSGANSAQYQITVGKNAFDEDKTAQVKIVLSDADNGTRRVDWIATVNADDQMNAAAILKTEAEQVFRLSSTTASITAGPSTPTLNAESMTVDSTLAKEVLIYAVLSAAVYADRSGFACYTPVNGWEPVTIAQKINIAFNLPTEKAVGLTTAESTPSMLPGTVRSGFYAQAFRKGGCIIVAFRGTELTDWDDIKADVINFSGGKPEQYKEAIKFMDQFRQDAFRGVTNITLTGHSLGGGLASYVALHNGLSSTVFNAAGLGDGLRNSGAKNMDIRKIVRNINVNGDPVSALGNQVGRIYALPIPISWIGKPGWIDRRSQVTVVAAAFDPNLVGDPYPINGNPFIYHSIETVTNALQALIE